jgi:hypothetical protein
VGIRKELADIMASSSDRFKAKHAEVLADLSSKVDRAGKSNDDCHSCGFWELVGKALGELGTLVTSQRDAKTDDPVVKTCVAALGTAKKHVVLEPLGGNSSTSSKSAKRGGAFCPHPHPAPTVFIAIARQAACGRSVSRRSPAWHTVITVAREVFPPRNASRPARCKDTEWRRSKCRPAVVYVVILGIPVAVFIHIEDIPRVQTEGRAQQHDGFVERLRSRSSSGCCALVFCMFTMGNHDFK